MNKKVLILGAVAMVAMAGCQNVTDQLGNKLAESMINSATNGEVKVNINDLQNGKINVTTKDGTISMSGDDNGGTLKMTDKDGKVVMDANGKDGSLVVNDGTGKNMMKVDGDKDSWTMTDDKGNTSSIVGGDSASRPSDAPADMPTLEGGTGFTTMKLGADSTTMVYKVSDKDIKAVCDKQTAALTSAGWTADSNSFNFEGSDGIMRNYVQGDFMMILSCGAGDGEDVSVTLQKNKKTA